jgi:DNA-binding Xre family transcriptional regulator
MPRTSKVLSREQRELLNTLAAFVKGKLAEEFPHPYSNNYRYEQIGQDTGLGRNTIERICKGEGANLDTLVPLARRLGCTVGEMITPPPKRMKSQEARPN